MIKRDLNQIPMPKVSTQTSVSSNQDPMTPSRMPKPSAEWLRRESEISAITIKSNNITVVGSQPSISVIMLICSSFERTRAV